MNASSFIRFHSAGDVSVRSGHTLGPRKLRDFELVYFPYGTDTVYEEQGVERILNKPCIILTGPNRQHSYRFDPARPTRHLFIHFIFTSKQMESRYWKSCDRDSFPLVASPMQNSLIPLLMQQILYYFYRRIPNWRSLSEMLFLSILEEFQTSLNHQAMTGTQSMPHQIAKIVDYIDKQLENPLEIKHLAEAAGWTQEHFTRVFRQCMGHSPREWIIKRKMEKAAQMLLLSTDSAKQVARDLGFQDEYYFYRLFKKVMGMTAKEYRNQYHDSRLQQLALPEEMGRLYPVNRFFALDPRRV